MDTKLMVRSLRTQWAGKCLNTHLKPIEIVSQQNRELVYKSTTKPLTQNDKTQLYTHSVVLDV